MRSTISLQIIYLSITWFYHIFFHQAMETDPIPSIFTRILHAMMTTKKKSILSNCHIFFMNQDYRSKYIEHYSQPLNYHFLSLNSLSKFSLIFSLCESIVKGFLCIYKRLYSKLYSLCISVISCLFSMNIKRSSSLSEIWSKPWFFPLWQRKIDFHY